MFNIWDKVEYIGLLSWLLGETGTVTAITAGGDIEVTFDDVALSGSSYLLDPNDLKLIQPSFPLNGTQNMGHTTTSTITHSFQTVNDPSPEEKHICRESDKQDYFGLNWRFKFCRVCDAKFYD